MADAAPKPGVIRGAGTELRNERCTICGHVAMYPCSKRQTIGSKWTKANLAHLKAAAAALGWTLTEERGWTYITTPGSTWDKISIDMTTGETSYSGVIESYAKQLKAQTSLEIVKALSKAKGFTLNWQQAKAGLAVTGTMSKW